jgi:hypothetical protein
MVFRKKSKITACLLLSLWMLLFLMTGCAGSKSADIKVAKQYAASRYGGQFDVVEYHAPVNAASGMRPARVVIEEYNFRYTLQVENGKVVGDDYSEQYAGWLVHEAIFDTMNANNTYPDFGGRELFFHTSFTVTDPSYLQMDLDLSSAKDYRGIMNIVNNAGALGTAYILVDLQDTDDYENEPWLYDFYRATYDSIDIYNLSYAVSKPNGKRYNATVSRKSGDNEPPLSRDEFLSLFYEVVP